MSDDLARRMWRVFEPVHAATYFAPETAEAYRRRGLKGFWMGYFAARAAPMGAVSAAVVEAIFYNFAPRRVRRAIPDAWSFATPAAVLDARQRATTAALVRVIPSDGEQLQRAVELAAGAVSGLEFRGRPLAAANAALELPAHPLTALWQLCTVLREHRGDGHVAALLDAEFDGLEAHVTLAGTGAVPRAVLQPARGWSDEEWQRAEERLRRRGLLADDATLTTEGTERRRAVEAATDRLARFPWDAVGAARTEELHDLLEPWSTALAAAGMLPVVNPMALPVRAPADG